jgi:hypothetical protein
LEGIALKQLPDWPVSRETAKQYARTVRPTEEKKMRFLTPYTTLAVGILIGWQVVPRVMAKLGH